MGLPEHSARVLVANLQEENVYKYCNFGNNFPMKFKVPEVFCWQGGILHEMESTYLFT